MKFPVVLCVMLAAATAHAHISLTSPAPRTTDQKQRVCGSANSKRGTNITTFAPGETITVTWNETINHPGHYRISFDPCGQNFSIPESYNVDTKPTDPNVLIDLIADKAGGAYSQDITLPNITCDKCTLQLFQMMTDKPPYSKAEPSDDIYYQCADIVLEGNAPAVDCSVLPPGGDAGIPGGPGGGGGTADGGCSTSGGAGLASLLALAGLAIRPGLRRRRHLWLAARRANR